MAMTGEDPDETPTVSADGTDGEEAHEPIAVSRDEALARWDAALGDSPVFADPSKPKTGEIPAPLVGGQIAAAAAAAAPAWPNVGMPDGRDRDALEVTIDATFGSTSAPADVDPVVDLLVTLTPNGPALLDPKAGPVAHVVLALDLSASMNAPEKYPVLTRALAGMLDELRRPGAVPVLLSVVVFAHGSELLFREVLAKDLSPRRLLDALDNSPLRFTRYTDIVGALSRAGRVARDSVHAHKALPVRIYVLTDGRPQDAAGAREMMERIHRLPVDIDGLSFGEDADVACLSSLITGSRGGSVKHVRPDTIEVAFGRIGEVAQRVVAPRAILDVELRSGVVGGAAYRFRPARHRYGDDAFENGKRFSRDLGTLESGRSYWLLFQVRLPAAKSTETEVGRITLRVPGFGGARVFEKLLSIPRHHGSAAAAVLPEVASARDVVQAIDSSDPSATLRALRMRRAIYVREQRDGHLIAAIDRAIAEVERHGSVAALPQEDQAVLVSHTLTKCGGAAGERGRR